MYMYMYMHRADGIRCRKVRSTRATEVTIHAESNLVAEYKSEPIREMNSVGLQWIPVQERSLHDEVTLQPYWTTLTGSMYSVATYKINHKCTLRPGELSAHCLPNTLQLCSYIAGSGRVASRPGMRSEQLASI